MDKNIIDAVEAMLFEIIVSRPVNTLRHWEQNIWCNDNYCINCAHYNGYMNGINYLEKQLLVTLNWILYQYSLVIAWGERNRNWVVKGNI